MSAACAAPTIVADNRVADNRTPATMPLARWAVSDALAIIQIPKLGGKSASTAAAEDLRQTNAQPPKTDRPACGREPRPPIAGRKLATREPRDIARAPNVITVNSGLTRRIFLIHMEPLLQIEKNSTKPTSKCGRKMRVRQEKEAALVLLCARRFAPRSE